MIKQELGNTYKKYKKPAKEELEDHITSEFTEYDNIKEWEIGYKKPVAVVKPEYGVVVNKKTHCRWCQGNFKKLRTSNIGLLCENCYEKFQKLKR